MSKDNLYKAPRGTYDILPGESFKWKYIIEKFRETASLFNYREIVTPIFEVVELFERSVGDGTDIVEKEMYKFTDRKGRIFALRPEGTAPVARSYIENRLDTDGSVTKLYYNGPMFRYDRPQTGRYRQFYQYGIEYIGSQHPYTDAEVICFADMFIRKMGITNYRLEVNSIGCPDCSQVYDKKLVLFFEKHLKELCSDCKNRIKTNPKRLLDCKEKTCREISTEAPTILDYLDEDCKTHFGEVCRYLDQLGIVYEINPRIVRGLDYYNRTAFELLNTGRGTQNALLGGGRYDGLIGSLGGKETPAVGLAGGFERLMQAMESENLAFGEMISPEVYLITMGEEASLQGTMICSSLREAGIAIEYDIEKSSVKKQIAKAAANNAKYVVILGDDELAGNRVTVKELATKTQFDIGIEEVVAELSKRLL